MASFPWLHVLHELHRLCSILRTFGEKKGTEIIFVLLKMTLSDSSLKYSPWISLGGPTRALGQPAELPALDPKLRGAAHGVVAVAPCAPPDLFHFAHF